MDLVAGQTLTGESPQLRDLYVDASVLHPVVFPEIIGIIEKFNEVERGKAMKGLYAMFVSRSNKPSVHSSIYLTRSDW